MQANFKMTDKQQSGFTLMEAMIALLIFSVGLLGLAGMQMSGLQNNHKAMMRTKAIQQAYEMADRIRSNSTDPLTTAGISTWSSSLYGSIPSGQGTVANAVGITGGFVVTVHWDEDRTGATGTNCPPKSSADLRCIQLTVVP